MLRSHTKFAAATLVAALGLLATPAAWAAPAGGVTVHRGASVTSEPAPSSGPVQLVRGAPAQVPLKDRAGPSAGMRRLAAGSRLWLVDAEAGRVTVCFTRRTTQVGREVIRCRSRDLPDGWGHAAD